MAFGRFTPRPAQPPMADINMTPLIDVMLVLLILFMVAAPLMGAALRLNLPESRAATAQVEALPAVVGVDAEGLLYWQGEAVDAVGLSERLQRLAAQQPEAELQLAVDRGARYERVALVLDAAQAAGLHRIAFAARGDAPAADPAASPAPTPAPAAALVPTPTPTR